MGLAASQARLISLEARMSDLEYEGQQINQQRQVLANKMNEVYNQAMNMEVPVAPSKIDFRVDAYTGKFADQAVVIKMGDDGNWSGTITKKTFTCSTWQPVSVDNSTATTVLKKGTKVSDEQAKELEKAGIELPAREEDGSLTEDVQVNKSVDENALLTLEQFRVLSSITNSGFDGSNVENAITALKNQFGSEFNEENVQIYQEVKDNKINLRVIYDGEKSELDSSKFVSRKIEAGESDISVYNITPTLDKYGNVESIDFEDAEGVHTIKVKGASDAYDEISYDAAMRDYERRKIEYDYEQNEYNKQTSIYQRQDKQLELKLTRLDNERNALNTEIDSVKKVIQDATEGGFKTFSG